MGVIKVTLSITAAIKLINLACIVASASLQACPSPHVVLKSSQKSASVQ